MGSAPDADRELAALLHQCFRGAQVARPHCQTGGPEVARFSFVYPAHCTAFLDTVRRATDLAFFGHGVETPSALPPLADWAGQLRSLVIINAGIDAIPDWVGDIGTLRVFACINTPRVCAIPAALGRCEALRMVVFTGIAVPGLPATLAGCRELRYVFLDNCTLFRLPDLRECPHLARVDISNCPLLRSTMARSPSLLELCAAGKVTGDGVYLVPSDGGKMAAGERCETLDWITHAIMVSQDAALPPAPEEAGQGTDLPADVLRKFTIRRRLLKRRPEAIADQV